HPSTFTQVGFGAAVDHTLLPAARSIAITPPPASALAGFQSEMAKYAFFASVEPPQITPPSGPPVAAMVFQICLPCWSGSRPTIMPDFAATTKTRFPPPISFRIGGEPISRSPPGMFGQLG